MTTRATETLKQLAADWKALYKSAKISGIVGDTSHAKRGGYHISRMDQVSDTNYSVVRPDDKEGPEDTASAIDMTMGEADMITCTKRLIKLYNNVDDPRRKYLNGFNGTTDGKTARRWDIYARKSGAATDDHLWHVHMSIRRKYVNSAVASKAILSGLKGESVDDYLKSIGVTPATKPTTATPKEATPKAPPYPGRELKRNDRQSKPDAAVKTWQARMLQRGWTSLGKPDGFFGEKTQSVVKRFQKECKLGSDGIIGPKTWPKPWTKSLGG